MKRLLTLGLLVLVAVGMALAQGGAPQVTQVTDKLFVITGFDGNVAFLVTNEGVLVVDAGSSPRNGKAILDIIKEKTDKPVKYLVLTHYHYDHTYGMQAFPSNVISIGQKNIITNLHEWKASSLYDTIEKEYREYIEGIKKKIADLKAKNSPDVEKEEKNLAAAQADYEEFKAVKIIDPVQTFEKECSISLGGETIDLIYPGPGHTRCNLVVYFRAQNVVHTGDLLFESSLPYIVWQDGTDTKNWAEFLRTMAKDWKIDKVIPGHGPITTKDGLLQLADYLTDLRAEVEAAMKKGQSLDEMKETIALPKYKDRRWPQLLGQNIESVYHELGGK